MTARGEGNIPAAGMRIPRGALGLGVAPAAPRSEMERSLSEIWADALNLDQVGVDDDFFELGGDSLSAEAVLVGVRARFGRPLQPSDFMTWPTVAEMAKALAPDPSGVWRPPSHVTMQRRGAGAAPVYFLHGGLGYFLPRRAFIDAIAPERPLFTIQTIGLRGEADPPRRIADIARAYLRSIDETTGARPFHLASVCAGADIALEMACQMTDEGRRPLSLTFFDAGAPYRMRKHRSPLWFADLRRWIQTEGGRLGGLFRRGPAPEGAVDCDTATAATAIRIVDAARRRHAPRPWSGDAHMIASAESIETRAEALRRLVERLEVQVLADRHHDLLRGHALDAGAALEGILAAADARAAEDAPEALHR